jgi:PITH domain
MHSFWRQRPSMVSQGSIPRSLLEYLDLSQLNCLNEVEEHNLKSILSTKTRNTTDSYLLSDTDEELLLNIHVCSRTYEALSYLRSYTASSIKLSGSEALSCTLLSHKKGRS